MVTVKKFFILVMALIPAAVLAGFQVVDEPAKVPVQAPAAGKQAAATAAAQSPKATGGLRLVALSYVGEPDADIPVISGFGRDLRLLEAIKQIAPSGWQAFLKEDVVLRADKVRGVSWKGGRRWVEVLDILANDQNLAIDVDWGKKHLYVGERRLPASLIAASESANDALSGIHWKIQSGEKISEAFVRWAKLAKWQLAWEAPDMVAQADIDLEGSFEDAVGKVVDALNRNASGLQAKFYTSNRVLRIVERK